MAHDRKRKLAWVILMVGLAAWLFHGVPDEASAATKKSNQWQYQCFESDDIAEITTQSNEMGQDGWEMVTSAGGKGGTTLWCFKRPLWKSR